MIIVKDHKICCLIPPYPFGPRRLAHFGETRADMFHEQLLEELPVK